MRTLLATLLGFASLTTHAQESPYIKFGKVTPAALQTKAYAIDSAADAVVLSDIGETAVEGNTKGWFSLNSTRHTVVHILNKAGYDHATVEVYLYVNGTDEERLENLKAVTYNLEGGKLVETKFDKSNLFTEKKDKNHIVKKFTLPNVKEGSIIEYEYKVTSDFISNVDPWSFQGSLPRLWSEFRFSIPQFFSYAFMSYGYQKAFVVDKKDRSTNFSVRDASGTGPSQNYTFNSGVTDHRWVMKDVPELKRESFTSTLSNHTSRIEFQLVSQNEPLRPQSFRNSWTNVSKELLEADYFGSHIRGSNGWLDDEMKPLLAGATTDAEKARRIYRYVRDGFSCTNYYRYTAEQSNRAVFKSHKGTVSEINLLLVAMLRHAGLQADPVILSQTDRGYTYDMYPMLTRFNYLIARLNLGGRPTFLDATHNGLGFGRLLPACYNGHARVVNEAAEPVYLFADSLNERKVTSLLLTNASDSWSGTFTQNAGYYESYNFRERIKEKGQSAFFDEIQKAYGADIKIADAKVDSLTNYDEPVKLTYKIDFHPEKAGVLYINPMFGEGYKNNPFKSAERSYPVEMPYTIDETYLLTMDVPEGYAVDELPKQIMARYDEEGTSFFEYRIQQSDNRVMLRSRIKLARAYYQPEEYEGLREFFNLVVKKHNEQIVFKKKANP